MGAIPTLDTLERIADALEIPIHRLLLEDGESVLTKENCRLTQESREVVARGKRVPAFLGNCEGI
jgi:hypothetical protein